VSNRELEQLKDVLANVGTTLRVPVNTELIDTKIKMSSDPWARPSVPWSS
jgi:hypothetical protein